MKHSVRFVTRAALIAALYFSLTVAVAPIAFGPIQFRLSEILVLLPVLFPEAIPGLAVGCFLANFFFSAYGLLDALIGTAATLVAAFLTYLLRKRIGLAAIPPVVLNAFLIPIIYLFDGTDAVYLIAAAEIFGTEALMVVISIPLTLALKRVLVKSGAISFHTSLKRLAKSEVYSRESCTHGSINTSSNVDNYVDNSPESVDKM